MENKTKKISFKKEIILITMIILFAYSKNILAQEDKPFSYYKIIEERNFFRPIEETKEIKIPKKEIKEGTKSSHKFILTGIVEIKGQYKAIIEESSGGGFYVEEKENVEDYIVEKVSQNEVILKKGDEKITLKLKNAKPERKETSLPTIETKEMKKEKPKKIEYRPNLIERLRKGNINRPKEVNNEE